MCESIRLVQLGAKRNNKHDTLRYGRYDMVRIDAIGAVRCGILLEERCGRNGVVASDTVRQLRCGKMRCGAVFTVRCGAVRLNTVRPDQVR